MASVLSCWFSVVFVFLSFPSKVVSLTTNRYVPPKPSNHTVGLTCGDSYCSSSCCYDSSSEELICCDDVGEEYLWWFWVAFIVVILLVSMCFGACCCKIRRIRARRHYLIVGGDNQPVVTQYGTEAIAPVIRGLPPGYTRNAPPLPPYTPVAENKGNPPPYQ